MEQQKSRRNFINSVVAAGGATVLVSSQPVGAQSVATNVVNVGPTRTHRTVQAALGSITNASATNRYLILVDPGRYVIANGGGPIFMKQYVAIAGVDRSSVVFVGDGNNNFRCASFVDLSNFSIVYTGAGTASGAIRSDVNGLREFHIRSLFIEVNSFRPAFASYGWIDRMEMRDTTIWTQGVGMDVNSGGMVYCHDNNIHMFGRSTGGPHIGIRANGCCRIFVFGGKIGTGYGYGEIDDPGNHVYGVLCDTACSGRVVLQSVWSIVRNAQATAGTQVNNVRVVGGEGWIRILSSYLQAERPGLSPAIDNPGRGRIEVYGSRVRHYGTGPFYGSNQVGLRRYTRADDNVALLNDWGGLLLLDASAGPFTVRLPGGPNTTEQFILKKVDASRNAVTIQGNGRLIDGATSRTLTLQYATLHVRFGGDHYYIVG